jgi:hypothetical protein
VVGNVPATRGRVFGLALIVLMCVVGAVMTLAGGGTGTGFSAGAGYLAFPGVVLFGLLLWREIRRLR